MSKTTNNIQSNSESASKDTSWFAHRAPEMANRWKQFNASVYDTGELDRKTKELIAVAASSLERCPHCTKGHIIKAQENGASKEEVSEALMVAGLISSGTELHWMKDEFEELLGAEE